MRWSRSAGRFLFSSVFTRNATLRRRSGAMRHRTTPGVRRRPHINLAVVWYLVVVNLLIILLVLLLLFGGGGFYLGGPAIGGGGIGLILVICLVIYFTGGFRRTKT
jgi:hypothetical protein